MNTKFDINEEILLKGKIIKIDITNRGVDYLVQCEGSNEHRDWYKTKDLIKKPIGTWVEFDSPLYNGEPAVEYNCSVCRDSQRRATKFCPNCGASMTNGKE